MGDWEFDRERIERLDPETRRRLYKQMIQFKLNMLEGKIQKITEDIDRLDEGISKLREKILMREIETFLEEGNDEK